MLPSCALSYKTRKEVSYENSARVSHCLAALISGSAEPTLCEKLMAMFQSLTVQPITASVARLLVAQANIRGASDFRNRKTQRWCLNARLLVHVEKIRHQPVRGTSGSIYFILGETTRPPRVNVLECMCQLRIGDTKSRRHTRIGSILLRLV